MTLGELVGQLYLATALVALGRSLADRTWLGIGLVVLGLTPIALYFHGLRLVLVGGLNSGSIRLACLLLGSVLLGQAFGLPRPIARRLGTGMKNRRWAFDTQLWQLNGEYTDAITLAQADPEARADALTRAGLLIGHGGAPHWPTAPAALFFGYACRSWYRRHQRHRPSPYRRPTSRAAALPPMDVGIRLFVRLGRWRRLSSCYEGSAASARAWLESRRCRLPARPAAGGAGLTRASSTQPPITHTWKASSFPTPPP